LECIWPRGLTTTGQLSSLLERVRRFPIRDVIHKSAE
jgi:hypothetical protein